MESSELFSAPRENKIDYWSIVTTLWFHKIVIIKFVTIVTIITVGITLLLPNQYRSTAVVLPDNEGAKLGNLGGLADLASIAGVSVGGGKSWVELYPQIIVSEAVLRNVIFKKFKSAEYKDSVNLIAYFDFDYTDTLKNYDKTLEKLVKKLEVGSDKKTRVVSVALILDESTLAADIVNSILQELDHFIRTKRISNASERRKWIDQRLSDVKRDLTKAENNLKEFRVQNRLITGSPQLLLEQQRFIREVEINSTIFIELKKQLELAKIDEINTMPIINILDSARQTTIKESPKRSIIVITMFLISLFISAGYLVIMNLYHERIVAARQRLLSIYNGK